MDTDPPTPLPPTRRCTPPARPLEADTPRRPTVPPFAPKGTPIHQVSPLYLMLADESREEIADVVTLVRAHPMITARTALAAVEALGHGLVAAEVSVPSTGKPAPLADDQRELLQRIIFFAAHALRE